MKKNLLFFIVLLVLLMGGCSNGATEESTENLTKVDNDNTEEAINETTDTDELENVDDNAEYSLSLVSHVEQLGMESFSDKGLIKNPDLMKRAFVSEKDGITYVVSYVYDSNELVISTIEHGEFIVKEKSVVLESLIGEGNQIGSIGLNGNNILITSYPISLSYDTKRIQTVTINQDGELTTSFNNENIPKDVSFDLIKGLDGSYFQLNENGKQTILQTDGTELYNHSTDGSYPAEKDYRIHFFDEHKGIIYFKEDSDLNIFDEDDANVIAFNINDDDLIWNDSGDSKLFNMQSSNFSHFISGDGGYYVVRLLSSDELQVSFYTIEHDDFVLQDQIEVPMTLEVGHRLFDVDITLGERTLNVYVNVVYKGKQTLQQYMFTRVK